MNKKIFDVALSTLFFAVCSFAHAQEPGKQARIGYLADSTAAGNAELLDAFRQQMSQLGWAEGSSLTIEPRFGEGRGLNRLSELAADLARLNVDVIVVAATSPALAAKKATSTIPIVMTGVGDPVRQRLITSLAHPGGNITGLAGLTAELGGKRLEILREVIPASTLVGILRGSGKGRGAVRQIKELQDAAPLLGLRLEEFGITGDPEQLYTTFQSLAQKRFHSIITTSGSIIFAHRKRIVRLAGKYRLPGIYPQKEFVDEGGLMSYGTDRPDLYRRSALYVDKILKGVKPADLPVEQPTKFEFVINLKTAKQIGVTIPPNVLARADRVIR